MKLKDDLIVNRMEIDDLNSAIVWGAEEGWNPICHAADAYYAVDPYGYFLLQHQHKTIATISRVRYPQGLAFIGFYIVEPPYRGQGYGKYLWDTVTKDIDKDAYAALDGVVAQIDKYQASGFEFYTMTSRYRKQANDISHIHAQLPTSISLSEDVEMTELIAYDQSVFSQKRENFLTHWLALPFARRLIAYDQHGICGYGQIVKAVDGYRISPLYADSLDIACYLYTRLCQTVTEDAPIHIDIPNNHPDAETFVNRFQLEKVFETARMYYHGRQPERCEHKEFGRMTLELG